MSTFVWLIAAAISFTIGVPVNACPPSDRAALLAFKASLHEPNLGIFNSWIGTDCCNKWYGVTCDTTTKRVADINLRGESEDPIFQKAHRQWRSLTRRFGGSEVTGGWKLLVSGGSKTSFGRSKPYIFKIFYTNYIIGTFARKSGGVGRPSPPLQCCATAHRTGYMTGSISPAICKLERLSSLIIADWKGISGTIPPCISSLPFLRILDLIGNQISGEIPFNIGNLRRLTVLNLADNKLTGRIPRSLADLSSLKHLDLRNNMISGTIPRNFGKLRMMSRCLLSGNRIYGPIPETISYIYRLSDLDLSLNRLSGPIPDSLGKMSVLGTLNLDGNMFTGKIPATLINSRISILNLSRNAIEGNIPDVFGPRSYFMVMDLSYNKLKGAIPKSISSASFIGHIDLSHNHLCGAIPEAEWFEHLEASSFMYNDCLCGKPLKAC